VDTIAPKTIGNESRGGQLPRLGLMLAGGGGMTIADMAELAERAEQVGFAGMYLAEAWRSGFVPLTAMAARTQRIKLSPYVLNAHARTPWITGMSAVDLDEACQGRLILGVGSGNRVTNESYQGVPVSRPLRKMREYVELLRRVVQAVQGERVDYEGEIHRMNGWVSQVTPFRQSIPIYLAATSPRMTELAATVADGIALGSLHSATFAGGIADSCRRSAGNRPFGVLMASFVAVDSDRERARNAARTAVVNLYAGKPHPHYDALLRQQGYHDVADELVRLVGLGQPAAARDAVSDEVIDELVIAGTPAECRARLQAYAGLVDEIILVNVNGMRYQTTPGQSAELHDALMASFEPIMDLGASVTGHS
jgi:5,10-methylenetetrahydromethanopterin reductase